MPQGYTLEQLKAIGTVPSQDAEPQKKGLTLQELQTMGAKPSDALVQQPDVAQPTPEPQKQSLLSKIAGGFNNVLTGIEKGVGSTVAGASALGEKMLLDPIDRMMGKTPPQQKLGEKLQQSSLLKPQGTAQKVGFGGEQIAEFLLPETGPAKAAEAISAASKLDKATGLLKIAKVLPRAATEAATFAGQTALQTGGDKKKVEQAAMLGAGSAGVGAAVKGAGKLLAAEPERLMGKALGFTKSQVRNLDKIAMENSAYRGIKDFALRHGFGGSREQIAQQVADRFDELTAGSKPEVLANMTEMTPNTYKSAFDHLLKTYDVPGQEKAAHDILEMSVKDELTGAELDKVRSYLDASLPQGAYKGAEPVKTEGLQNLVDPIRRRLEQIDPTGTIKRVNQDIRILYQMRKAAEHAKAGTVEGAAAFRTLMRGGGTAALQALGVPLPKIATVPYVIYQGVTDFPQVASYVASKLKGAQEAIPDKIPMLLRKALERWK